MRAPNRIAKLAQALSLDVALGAVCCSAMFCRLVGLSPLPWAQLWTLGGTVLFIYTADHQADVYRMPGPPLTERHRFHFRYRRLLRPLAGVLAVGLAGAALPLPRPVLVYGLLLAGAVGAYLLVVSRLPEARGRRWFHKEILVAALYTAGVWGSVAVRAGALPPFARLAGVIFALLALQNLLLFSYLEWEEDVSQGQRSLARSWGTGRVRIAMRVLSVVLIGLLAAGWGGAEGLMGRAVWFTLAAMTGVLGALCAFPAAFRRRHRYRLLGDGVFLLAAWALFG
jgi:4-hydroxybenzoate polyprenyltransferase